jgi:KDO2-lipid IV(A) lauroyltransferase
MTHTPAEHPDFDLTDQYMKMLEKDICTTPHMWLWTHKRWSRTKEEWLKRQKSN